MSDVFRSRARATAVLFGIAILLVVGVAPEGVQEPWVQAIAWIVLVSLLAALLWLRRRDRAAYEAALTAQAVRVAVAEDRLAIARDLHDLVSGSLGAITVRAAVAQRLETDVEGLRTALSEVEQTSRAATADLRSMLGVLRGQGSAPQPGSTRPAPTVPLSDAVEQAADAARGLGLEVRTRVEADGVAADEPCGSGLALAVVREGLANTARHAGPVAVDVCVDVVAGADGEALRVEVADAGPAPGWVAQPGTGTGLTALAERAAAMGAQLSAGPRETGVGTESPGTEPSGTEAGAPVAHGRPEGGDGTRPALGVGFRLSARIPVDAQVRR
ncbi:sensor histidine kinase [Actinomyces sp. W5033]|uniref:sensor histidine kinase n=1 Tax=Actinomyces sp. W5033 TaxID=3446479 RepID=UPI003EDEDEE0